MAASDQVLGIVELLEKILFHLDTKTLLLAQRVCKQWRALVKRSKKLQQALFFEPVNGGTLVVNINSKLAQNHWKQD